MRRKSYGDGLRDDQLVTMVDKFMEFVQTLPRKERITVLNALESSLQVTRESLYKDADVED